MISDFSRIEKSVNGRNYFEIQENNFTCEFTTHYTCRHAGMNLKSITTNRFKFWLTNSLWNLGEGGGGGGGTHGTRVFNIMVDKVTSVLYCSFILVLIAGWNGCCLIDST